MIENIARAIILKDSRILLARQIGCGYTFLPGGHIEFGETAETALHRELHEEIGIKGRCGKFICTIENIFTDAAGKKCHEIALYYLYHPEVRHGTDDYRSLEAHLEFIWADIDELEGFNIKPGVLDDVLQKLSLNKKPDRFYSVKE